VPAETLTPLGCDEANQRDPRGGSPMARSHVDVVGVPRAYIDGFYFEQTEVIAAHR